MNLLSLEMLPWIVAACLAARLLLVAARLEIARGELAHLRQRLASVQALLSTPAEAPGPVAESSRESLPLEEAMRHADEVTQALRSAALHATRDDFARDARASATRAA